jgi:hypothetical protein
MQVQPVNAVQTPPPVLPEIRRFDIADLSSHGKWILPRILRLYPHLNERTAAGWLRNLCDSNEHLFLYRPHAVGLAQSVRSDSIRPKPVVYERFVFAEDVNFLEEALDFYVWFNNWARHLGAEAMIVCENTDVLPSKIEAKLGKIRTVEQKWVKIK